MTYLREAIRIVRDYRNGKARYTISGDEPTTNACIDLVLAAAESTLPKTKMVEVWRVECVTPVSGGARWRPITQTFLSLAAAQEYATDGMIRERLAHITGPHWQEVPDETRL